MNSTNEQRCPSCNKTALITDDNSGEIVCKSCGLVLSEGSEAAGPEWRSFANDGVDKSRTGTGTSITMHDMGLSTVIGAVNKGLGKLDEAIEAYKKSSSIKPSYAEAYYNIAMIFQEKGKLEEAIAAYDKTVLVKPDYADAHYNQGNALKDQGKLEEAIEAYNKALSIKPDYTEAYNNIGIALQEQGKLDEAIASYNKALKIKPDHALAYNNMGVALQEKGTLKEAIEAYNKALTIDPNYPSAHSNLVAALKGFTFEKPSPNMHKVITLLLDNKSYVRPNTIATTVINLLKFEPNLHKYLHAHYFNNEVPNIQDIIINLSRLPLLLKLMSVCPLPDMKLEELLTNLRSTILSNISALKDASSELLTFQSALALHCFTNEYIYGVSDNEYRLVELLESKVDHMLSSGGRPSSQIIR